jgi:hypothetical protein
MPLATPVNSEDLRVFNRSEPKFLVLEIEKPEHIPAQDLLGALTSLRGQTGFRYLLQLLRLQVAAIDRKLLNDPAVDLAQVARLQGYRAGLRHAETLMRRWTEMPEETPRDAAPMEIKAFRQARNLIEEIK